MRQKKLKPSETSKVLANDIRRLMANNTLIEGYFTDMNKFVEIVSDMTAKQIERNNFKKVYQGDVAEIVQQVCYLMLNHEVNREMFEGEGKSMTSYVYTLIKSCIVRISWGRDKYGDGYVLK